MTNNPVADLVAVIRNALDFANRAAGEGIEIDGLSPEDFLMEYNDATGNEDWDSFPDRIAAIVSAALSPAERNQALAQAAAAAMDMRERAATHTQWTAWGERHVLTEAARKAIRALPIDPDAQEALDKLLAKAREDAIREAAALCVPKKARMKWGNRFTPSTKNPQSAAAQAARKQCQDAIHALLTVGETK